MEITGIRFERVRGTWEIMGLVLRPVQQQSR